jgi:hypothetical protein
MSTFEANRKFTDQELDNIKFALSEVIRNRVDIDEGFILYPVLFEDTAAYLREAFITKCICLTDYQYYVKKFIDDHIITKELRDDFKKCIVDTWYNIDYLFPTAKLIYNTTKIPINDIKKILSRSETYLEFKTKPKQKQFRMITAEYIDNIWQADLIDLYQTKTPYKDSNNKFHLNPEEKFIKTQNLKRENIYESNYDPDTGFAYTFILVVIDVFSRYVWTRNLFSNKAEEIKNAFIEITESNYNKYYNKGIFRDKTYQGFPDILQTDIEKAFISNDFQDFLIKHEVNFWPVTPRNTKDLNRQKAAICERVIQTIKKALWKVFEMRGNYRWYDVIDEVVDAYNARVHSTIKITPNQARRRKYKNHVKLYVSKHSEKYRQNRSKLPKYKIGDRVRVLRNKATFEKGYQRNYSKEVYVIDNIIYNGCYFYTLDGEYNRFNRKEMFYEEDLIPS